MNSPNETEQLRAELERVTNERNALDIELTGSKYAVALLHRECGLDEQSEDLREVALLVARLRKENKALLECVAAERRSIG